jgi:hypothetical protein
MKSYVFFKVTFVCKLTFVIDTNEYIWVQIYVLRINLSYCMLVSLINPLVLIDKSWCWDGGVCGTGFVFQPSGAARL